MYEPAKCCKIVVVCFILHNICVTNNLPIEEDSDDTDDDTDDDDVDDRVGNDPDVLVQQNRENMVRVPLHRVVIRCCLIPLIRLRAT